MPSPVNGWSDSTPLTAKSLNLALYTSDGTSDNLTGVAFQSFRPILFEAYRSALSPPISSGGTQSSLSGSGTVAPCWVIMDSAGYFGQTSDLPGHGYYQFQSVTFGSVGDGKTSGGWFVLSHFPPMTSSSSVASVGADIFQDSNFYVAGTRQKSATTHDNTPFFLDLVNSGLHIWSPSVKQTSTAGTFTTGLAVNTTDSSGETPRFNAIWAGIASTSTGTVSYDAAGTYEFTAPLGVSQVTVAAIGAGGGGGGGQPDYGGGGGGGGGFSSGVVGVTPSNNYTITVGGGGTAGTAGSSPAAAGGVSSFAGDTSSVLSYGGNGGGSATATANGVGGAGGSANAAPIIHNGGTGATGAIGKYGGGGGGSGGNASAGNNATSGTGAAAVPGGGAGGDGGQSSIGIVQYAHNSKSGNTSLTVNFGTSLQPGNTVVACVYYQATNIAGTVNVTLDDGTPLSSQADDLEQSANYDIGVYAAAGVPGGENSLTISGPSGKYLLILCQLWEISGLGTSITTDVSNTATNYNKTYDSGNVTTSGAPDLWIGTVAGVHPQTFSFGSPGSGWTSPAEESGISGGNSGRLRSGYQIVSAAGNMRYKGSISTSSSFGSRWSTVVLAITSSAASSGSSPLTPPGGGGGGGLGSNSGGNGADGQVTLTWTAETSATYGTPDLPNPVAVWDANSTISAALMNGNTGVRDIMNFLSNPPMFRNNSTIGQSISSSAATTVILNASPDADTYAGWTSANNTYTVQRNGLYLIGAMVAYGANSSGLRQTGVSINGTIYWGPGYLGTSADEIIASKVQIFSLLAGDTIKLIARQTSGSSLNLSTANQSRLFAVWLGKGGVPTQSWTPPDVSFRWQSGTTPDQLPDLFNEHLSNDIGFLVQRPFLMSYQASAQSGFSPGGGGGASFTKRIGHGSLNSSTSKSWSASVSSATSGSGSLVVAIAFGNLGGTVSSVSDTKGNTYTQDYAANTTTTGGRALEIWRANSFTALTTSDTITATISTAQDHGGVIICDEFSTLTATDANAINWTGVNAASNSVTLTATASDSIAYSACFVNDTTSGLSVTGFSATGSQESAAIGTHNVDLLTSYGSPPSGGGNTTASYSWSGTHPNFPIALGYTAPAPSSSFFTVTMDTVTGIVHGDEGDNYAGWNSGPSNSYSAPVSGWYLVCGEIFLTSTSASDAAAIAAISAATSGGFTPSATPDWYQNNLATNNAAVGAGATIFGLYYLSAGETITPQIQGKSYSANYGTLTGTNLNGGTTASHMEIIWISE